MVAVGALALVAGAAAMLMVNALRSGAKVDVPPPVVAVVDAGVPAVEVDAGAVVEVDAGAVPAPAPVPVPVPVPKVGPVTLTPALIMKVVRTQTAAVSKCFEQNKADLPGATGQLAVNFTIAGNGRVAAVKSQLPDKKVGKCVEGVVAGMKFPAHKDKEVTLTLPFAYQVN